MMRYYFINHMPCKTNTAKSGHTEITKEQYYAQKELNEIYYKKCHETGDISLLSKCKIIMEKDGKYWEI